MVGLITDNSTISMKFANAMKDFLKKHINKKDITWLKSKDLKSVHKDTQINQI